MKISKEAMLKLIILGGLLLGLAIADICTPDRLFSAYENRVLASKPDFNLKALLNGSYTEEYETYVTDQFVGRDNWIFIKTITDLTLGKKEVNGVYLAKDGTLIEKHDPDDIDEEMVEKRLLLLKRLSDWWENRLAARQSDKNGTLHVMIVPTADNIYPDKLPDNAPCYAQSELMEKVAGILNDNYVIDVTDTLNSHKTEYIYYGTDHHWTTLGAYYAYLEWAEEMDMTPVSYNVETVSEHFFGTLHSKTNLVVKPDTIEAYVLQSEPDTDIKVYYDFSDEYKNSLYEEKHLETKNQYGYFLDDNHAFIRIERENPSPETEGKSLFVIKDSYANCLIPFLTNHYETIYVLDLRYYKGSLFSMLETYDTEGSMDILVLYNVIHFIEEFQYY